MRILHVLALRRALVCAVLLLLGGCESLNFYRQAALGQWQLMRKQEPVADLLADPATDPTLRQHLARAVRVLEFAEQGLGLAAEERYRSYVALKRRYVVWNVFAAPADALTGVEWCYPIAGCAPYRGYFAEAAARGYAARLDRDGFETWVGGVPAYSTLGWFNDPLLSTFIDWPEGDLVNLLIHELSHSRVWRDDDVAFNESFASFVGQTGTRAWFEREGRSADWSLWQARAADWQHLRALLLGLKHELQEIFASASPPAELARRKQAAYSALRACYAQANVSVARQDWTARRFDALINEHLNNAYLVSLGTYADHVPAFAQLFENEGRDWSRFFNAVDRLAALDNEPLRAALTALSEARLNSAEHRVDQRTDNQYAEQVECQPFLRHRAHADTPG